MSTPQYFEIAPDQRQRPTPWDAGILPVGRSQYIQDRHDRRRRGGLGCNPCEPRGHRPRRRLPTTDNAWWNCESALVLVVELRGDCAAGPIRAPHRHNLQPRRGRTLREIPSDTTLLAISAAGCPGVSLPILPAPAHTQVAAAGPAGGVDRQSGLSVKQHTTRAKSSEPQELTLIRPPRQPAALTARARCRSPHTRDGGVNVGTRRDGPIECQPMTPAMCAWIGGPPLAAAGRGGESELGVDVGQVGLHRARRDEKLCGDVLVGQCFANNVRLDTKVRIWVLRR